MAKQRSMAVIWDYDYTQVDSSLPNFLVASKLITQITGKTAQDFPALRDHKTYIKALWSYRDWRDFYYNEIGLTPHQLDDVSTRWAKESLSIHVKPKFYKGIEQTVASLYRLGIRQAIQSDNTEQNIRRALKEKGLLRYFTSIKGYDTMQNAGKNHKPSPDGFIDLFNELNSPDIIYCIGDDVKDNIAASNLGAHLVEQGLPTQVRTIWAIYGLTPERISLFQKEVSTDYNAKTPQDISRIIASSLWQLAKTGETIAET